MRKIIRPKVVLKVDTERAIHRFLWFPVWLPNLRGETEFRWLEWCYVIEKVVPVTRWAEGPCGGGDIIVGYEWSLDRWL